MNAQQVWKTWYRSSKIHWYNKAQCRVEERLVRREAALERSCETLQRKVNELQEVIDVCCSSADEEREAMNL